MYSLHTYLRQHNTNMVFGHLHFPYINVLVVFLADIIGCFCIEYY